MIQNSELASDIKELLENINWDYLSVHSLVDVVENFPVIRENKVFKKIFAQEMNKRLQSRKAHHVTSLCVETIETPPRRSYKYRTNEESAQPFLPVLIEALLEQRDEISAIINEHTSSSTGE